jgi:RNA polymerase sigma-70 factor (ECF subfamily)
MNAAAIDQFRDKIDAVYRADSRRVFATLVRLLGDFDLAEEALHDAFASAMKQWPEEGIPDNPRAWLVSAGRFKAIDTIRRRARFDASLSEIADQLDTKSRTAAPTDREDIEDDRLRLIFTCCHPALSPEAQVALTLREVCELTTEAIASAFLTTPSTLAQRIVRAKSKIRDAGIPFDVPSTEDLPDRIDSVLQVVYLVFNEGYTASSGETLTRPDLSGEAIRLGRLLVELLPESEVLGLLALMLLHESRRTARTTPTGELILLDEQDRSLWNRDQIEEGRGLVARAFSSGQIGPYTVQAAISSVHSAAQSTQQTNWNEIVALYDLLTRATPSPIVELNRAVAISMRDNPAAGLELIDAILTRGDLADYHLAHAARADMLRRLGQNAAARNAYKQALQLARQEPERRFLEQRLAELA